MYQYLRKVPLFADLAEEDLDRLCQDAEEIHLPAGTELFVEGSNGDKAYVIKEGQIEILKVSGGRQVLLAVRKEGDVIGEMSLLEATPRFASGRARTDSVLLAIGHKQLDNLLNTRPTAARAMLNTFIARLRASEQTLQQSERMAQLGRFTAGIAHELNNPAAAVHRSADQLTGVVAQLQSLQMELAKLELSPGQTEALLALDDLARRRAAEPVGLESMERSDREAELEIWLDERGVENAWEVAPVLVNLGYAADQLRTLGDNFSPAQLPVVIRWLCTTYSCYDLMAEMTVGAGRISEIVKALKTYVYLDQAPVGLVDVHEGLDNTLVMLRGRLKNGILVRREYAADLPRIQAYGSELNQVWTNIIDNSIDALDGKGEITISTRRQGDWVVVEIADNGPGIPTEIQSKIFNPFFTTKPVGHGTGLGLNTSYNIIQKHLGEIKVFSRPGLTRFTVRLPVNLEAARSGEKLADPPGQPDDAQLLRILKDTRTIAVVGFSENPQRPGYSVPAYLQAHGYRIIPVNPKLKTALGEQAYPDLLSVPDPVDTVLIFRRSEFIPPIVDEAIRIRAKVVWMQEGIINEPAAATAQEAGLEVVMDTCMRQTHRRLVGD